MKAPARILMLKSHSAGIGDLLRGSAAWRVLKNQWPDAELHLLFLTKEPGYASERLIRQHHLLDSLTVIDKRAHTLAEWRKFWAQIDAVGREKRPDLVIDFESNGVRTSLIAFWLARRFGARTAGTSTFPGRGLFYSHAAESRKKYASRRGLSWPMDYTNRDFVTLASLGLERNGCPIELFENEAGRHCRESFFRKFGLADSEKLLGLNIGCGTPGAAHRRPSLPLLAKLVAWLQEKYRLRLVIGFGPPFESEVDREFLGLLRQQTSAPFIDLCGTVDLTEVNGVMKSCALFLSGDSGPYHMAVALKTPTLAIFNFDSPQHTHHHPWVKCVVANKVEDLPMLTQAADELMREYKPWPPSELAPEPEALGVAAL